MRHTRLLLAILKTDWLTVCLFDLERQLEREWESKGSSSVDPVVLFPFQLSCILFFTLSLDSHLVHSVHFLSVWLLFCWQNPLFHCCWYRLDSTAAAAAATRGSPLCSSSSLRLADWLTVCAAAALFIALYSSVAAAANFSEGKF